LILQGNSSGGAPVGPLFFYPFFLKKSLKKVAQEHFSYICVWIDIGWTFVSVPIIEAQQPDLLPTDSYSRNAEKQLFRRGV
jgi:hypothetical protein